jgi:DNA adenine methylase
LRRRALRSFIAWVGGKRQLAKQIVSLIPEHRAYVEVFGGAGWVLFAKPKNISSGEIFNNINKDLIGLFRVVRERLAEFYCRQNFLLTSNVEFQEFLERSRRGAWLDDVDRAVGLYYLIKNSFSNLCRSYSLRCATRIPYKPDPAFLEEVRDRLRGVQLHSLDFEELIGRTDRPETFYYLDPPYTVADRGGYYQHAFSEKDHRRLARVLRAVKGRFLLSYDDVPLVRELYAGFHIEETSPLTYTMCSTTSRPKKKATELLIRNY